MKKSAIFLTLILCVFIVFAACNGNTPGSASTPISNGTSNASSNNASGSMSNDSTATNTGDIKIGQAIYGAHGTSSWCVATVALSGDTIVAAWIDEYQFLGKEGTIAVPNADNADGLGQFMPADRLLGSKRVNWESYSENMKNNGNATKTILEGYTTIEDYVTGKTVAAVTETAGLDANSVMDAVSGATLVDTKGYLQAIVEAAKNAK